VKTRIWEEFTPEDVKKLIKILGSMKHHILTLLNALGFRVWGRVHHDDEGVWLRIRVYKKEGA